MLEEKENPYSKYYPRPASSTLEELKYYFGIGTLRQEGWDVTDLPQWVDIRTLGDWRRPTSTTTP